MFWVYGHSACINGHHGCWSGRCRCLTQPKVQFLQSDYISAPVFSFIQAHYHHYVWYTKCYWDTGWSVTTPDMCILHAVVSVLLLNTGASSLCFLLYGVSGFTCTLLIVGNGPGLCTRPNTHTRVQILPASQVESCPPIVALLLQYSSVQTLASGVYSTKALYANICFLSGQLTLVNLLMWTMWCLNAATLGMIFKWVWLWVRAHVKACSGVWNALSLIW